MATVPTPTELQYQQEHINDTQVPGLIAASVVCLFLGVTSVALRVWCRQMGRIKHEYDDWLILCALVLAPILRTIWGRPC